MIPSAFNYHRPETVDGVVSLLAEWGDDADRTVLASEVWPPWDPASNGFDVAFLPPWEEMRKDGA